MVAATGEPMSMEQRRRLLVGHRVGLHDGFPAHIRPHRPPVMIGPVDGADSLHPGSNRREEKTRQPLPRRSAPHNHRTRMPQSYLGLLGLLNPLSHEPPWNRNQKLPFPGRLYARLWRELVLMKEDHRCLTSRFGSLRRPHLPNLMVTVYCVCHTRRSHRMASLRRRTLVRGAREGNVMDKTAFPLSHVLPRAHGRSALASVGPAPRVA